MADSREIQHTNSQWGNWLRSVKAAVRSPDTAMRPELVGDQLLEPRLQSSVLVDDVSYLAAPRDYALGGAGYFSENPPYGAGLTPVLELVAPASLEGLWVLAAQVINTTGTFGLAFDIQDATIITANLQNLTARQLGTAALRATVQYGTYVAGTRPSPLDLTTWYLTQADLPLRVWVPGGKRINFAQLGAYTALLNAAVYWLEVPRTA